MNKGEIDKKFLYILVLSLVLGILGIIFSALSCEDNNLNLPGVVLSVVSFFASMIGMVLNTQKLHPKV